MSPGRTVLMESGVEGAFFLRTGGDRCAELQAGVLRPRDRHRWSGGDLAAACLEARDPSTGSRTRAKKPRGRNERR
ncbi:hypothetical protein NHX12_033341 [Muraenolepis orangiensis]|uniref:Uncharacterized protein n=1 Tax=Muraenolepis orangiensis TaxID=630683 RepID=A0A9Q0E3Q9_9TELE|nr:hypothetical protein NHX12_033341 [Muraenolepis orangiensis]